MEHSLLPSLIVAHGTPCTTPEPLGPFMLRPAPIWACHPEPIDGWLTCFSPSLIIPTPVCVCGGSSTTVPPSPLHPPPPLLSHLLTNQDAPCPIFMSDPDTGLPPVRAIIRIG